MLCSSATTDALSSICSELCCLAITGETGVTIGERAREPAAGGAGAMGLTSVGDIERSAAAAAATDRFGGFALEREAADVGFGETACGSCEDAAWAEPDDDSPHLLLRACMTSSCETAPAAG